MGRFKTTLTAACAAALLTGTLATAQGTLLLLLPRDHPLQSKTI